jgi:hypothetical protein
VLGRERARLQSYLKVTGAEWIAVITLLIAAASARLIGIRFGTLDMSLYATAAARGGLPYNAPVHPDEFFYVVRPLRMLVTGQLNPKFFENPSFLIHLNFFTYLLTDAGAGYHADTWRGIDERQHAPFNLYLIGRVYSALGGLVAVAATYTAARGLCRHIGSTPQTARYGGLAAALLVGVSLPMVQHAHYSTTSSLAAGFAAVAIAAALRSLWDQRAWLLPLAGAAAGMAAGCRYNAVIVASVVGLVGLYLISRASRQWWVARRVLLAYALIPIAFLLTTPHALFDTEFFISQVRYILRHYVEGANLDYITPYGLFFEVRYGALFGLGIPAVVLIGVGVVKGWRSGIRTIIAIMAVYWVLYALIVLRTVRPAHSDQLWVPILPSLAIWAGVGGAEIIARLYAYRRLSVIAVIAVLVIVPLSFTVPLLRAFTLPDTRAEMAAWIQTRLPAGARIHLNGPYNVPLDETRYRLSQNFGGDLVPLTTLQEAGVEYVVFSDAWYNDEFRAREINSESYRATLAAYLSSYDASVSQIARIDRPSLIGDTWVMHTASVWHQPTIAVYVVLRD